MKHLFTLIFAMLITLAGFSQKVATQVTLNGSGNDPDGTIVSYSWKQISGPADGTIVTPNAAITIVKDYSTAGIHIYELTVTDNQGATASAQTKVTVLPANLPPFAKADSEIVIQLPSKS